MTDKLRTDGEDFVGFLSVPLGWFCLFGTIGEVALVVAVLAGVLTDAVSRTAASVLIASWIVTALVIARVIVHDVRNDKEVSA